MRWPAPGPQSKQGVCLYKLISQTKRALCPTSCFGSRQSVWSGKERPLRFTWQNKMGPRHDREDNISASKMTHLNSPHVRLLCLQTGLRQKYRILQSHRLFLCTDQVVAMIALWPHKSHLNLHQYSCRHLVYIKPGPNASLFLLSCAVGHSQTPSIQRLWV